ncbi:hypothetical protein Patl1_15400 [Pistacia atlantica]|uniref:Uncharacterized protein n=1 Tax=Pistacia atlantica TaxID=434234 RepID=A0ACC1B5E3_9ROSI|nr:hypothetical protein Patl1_15400 [Pistacia atlantica]
MKKSPEIKSQMLSIFSQRSRVLSNQTPCLKTDQIYVTGESYAGKYIPATGYYILKKNLHLQESKRVNLQGVARLEMG